MKVEFHPILVQIISCITSVKEKVKEILIFIMFSFIGSSKYLKFGTFNILNLQNIKRANFSNLALFSQMN